MSPLTWRLFAFCGSLLVVVSAFGQDKSSYVQREWDEHDGLPVKRLLNGSILQTLDGYLWIGTRAGLVRFDGLHFETFKTDNTEGLPDNRITQLYESRDSSLWIATQYGYLVRYKNRSFTPFISDDDATPNPTYVSSRVVNKVVAFAFGHRTFRCPWIHDGGDTVDRAKLSSSLSLLPTAKTAMKSALIVLLCSTTVYASNRDYDVVVYGGTSAAVAAAVQVSSMGKSVIVVSPDQHLGGLSSGGLGWTDSGRKEVIGGLAREFYHRVYLHYENDDAWKWQKRSDYGNKGQGTAAIDGKQRTMWIFEPHAAEKAFEGL